MSSSIVDKMICENNEITHSNSELEILFAIYITFA